jgi:hypothetical protein
MAMTNNADAPPPGDDIDLLLPWYATERLDPAERARVADALARDPELALRLSLAEDERLATEELHEALPAPSARVRQDLFARIEALEGGGRSLEPGGVLARIVGFFGSLSPRTTAMAAGFAALLILVQAGFLASSLLRENASFQVASHGGSTEEGSFALVSFAPAATADKIVETLEAEGARITEGPFPGGMFRVRLSPRRLDRAALEEAVARLTRRADVVRLAVPAETR